MQYKALGNRSDLQVSAIALGCWPFAGGEVWGAQDDADSIAAVRAALDEGINFLIRQRDMAARRKCWAGG